MLRRALSSSLAVAVGLACLVAPGVADALLPGAREARDGRTALSANLSGRRETVPGDRDGVARADVRLLPGRACFRLRWSGVAPPVSAELRRGARGAAGPVAVLLFAAPGGLPPDVRSVHGCAPAGAAALAAVRDHPGRFYLEVRTTELPAGAVRGQLFRATHTDAAPPAGPAATLAGAEEVPGPGDGDGAATAHLRARGARVCFQLRWRDLAPVTAIHVHEGGAGTIGGVAAALVVGELPATLDGAGGCVTGVDRTLVRRLRSRPAGFYVNLHTTGHVDGAVRGQLRPGS